jgi:hypothetical protein
VHFVAAWLREGLELGILGHDSLKAFKRLLLIADFRYDALADEIEAFLAGCETPFRAGKAKPRADPQLTLSIYFKFLGRLFITNRLDLIRELCQHFSDERALGRGLTTA